MAGCRCGWLLTYTTALSRDSRHHAASTSTDFASDFRRTRRYPDQSRNFTALRRYVGRIRGNQRRERCVLYRLSYVCMRGVLVFPSRQIFSVPRFCQQITGAITTSRLEGLTSGLRIAHTAIPLARCPRRIGADGWTRTNDIPPGAVLYRLSYICGWPLPESHWGRWARIPPR